MQGLSPGQPVSVFAQKLAQRGAVDTNGTHEGPATFGMSRNHRLKACFKLFGEKTFIHTPIHAYLLRKHINILKVMRMFCFYCTFTRLFTPS